MRLLFPALGAPFPKLERKRKASRRRDRPPGRDPAGDRCLAHVEEPHGDIEREAAVLTRAEVEDMEGVLELAGAAAFLRTLPPRRWAVVTSAPRALALARLERAGIPVPPVLVTAEDVTRGKPAPDCFLLAARKLGVAPGDCLVWEDAPSGIAAAEAAGATVLVVTATHAHPMATSHPVVASYEGLAAGLDAAGRLTLALAGSRPRRGLTA